MASTSEARIVEVNTVKLWGHQEKPLLLLEREDIDFVHLDGGRGSGKSTPINAFNLQEAHRYKANAGLFFRRKTEDAVTTDYALFRAQTPPELVHDSHTEGQKRVVEIIPNDYSGDKTELSRIIFGGVISEGKQSADNTKGEFGFVSCPELDQIEENVAMQAFTSLRKLDSGRKSLTASNRVDRFHWIRKFWPMDDKNTMAGEDFWLCQNEDCKQYGLLVPENHACKTEHRVTYRGGFEGYASIWSRTTDNKSLPKDYIQKNYANKPAAWVAKYIDGKSGFDPDGRGVFEKTWRADLSVHEFPVFDTWVVRSFDPDLNPAVVWSQYARMDGINHFFLRASISGYNCKYSDFLLEAFELQREIFGAGMQYKDCGDPKLRATCGQSKQSYLQILAQFGITNVDMRSDILGNSRSYRVQIVEAWLEPMGGSVSRFHVHPCNDVVIEALDGGYKNRFVQTLKKVVQEPVKDDTYSGVMDCTQYALTNYSDLEGNVRLLDSRVVRSRNVAPQPRSTESMMPRRRPASRIVRG